LKHIEFKVHNVFGLKFFDLNWDEIETIETAIITTTTRHMKAQQIL